MTSYCIFNIVIDIKHNLTARRKSQVVIRRPPQTKSRPRAHISDDISEEPLPSTNAQASCSSVPANDGIHSPGQDAEMKDTQDELASIRSLLRPPPIPGLDDWGIPPPSAEPCDATIEASSIFMEFVPSLTFVGNMYVGQAGSIQRP